jgi:NADH dehydrogenase FAD-containing subunit
MDPQGVTKHIVILGAGTGGTLVANRFRRVHALEDVRLNLHGLDLA